MEYEDSDANIKIHNFSFESLSSLSRDVLRDALMDEFNRVVVENWDNKNLDLKIENYFLLFLAGNQLETMKTYAIRAQCSAGGRSFEKKENVSSSLKFKPFAFRIWHKFELFKTNQNGSVFMIFREKI